MKAFRLPIFIVLLLGLAGAGFRYTARLSERLRNLEWKLQQIEAASKPHIEPTAASAASAQVQNLERRVEKIEAAQKLHVEMPRAADRSAEIASLERRIQKLEMFMTPHLEPLGAHEAR